MADWFYNGDRTETVSIDDRGFQYGDGLFETIAIRDGNPRLFALHMERLQVSCRRLGMGSPDDEYLASLVSGALESAGRAGQDALVKIIVTRGVGKRGYAASTAGQAAIVIGVFDRPGYPESHYTDGVPVRLCRTRLAAQPQTAGLKTLSRLDQVLASSEDGTSTYVEGMMLDQDGNVVCGTKSNLFVVSKGKLSTPEITQCGVSGIMRRHIMQIADEHGMDVLVNKLPAEILANVDEMFICNSQFGIWPVARIESRIIEHWPTTSAIMTFLRQHGVTEGPR